MRFVWTPELSVGIELIDAQHRELYARLDHFLATAAAGRVDELLDLLHFLAGYIEEHFRTEEELMRSSGYPDLDAHVAEHGSFHELFATLVARFARYGDDARVTEFARREVCTWLEAHVCTTDRVLAEWLRAHAHAQVA